MAESGSQVVSRAGSLLRALADGEPDGVTTTAAGRSAGMPRATAHRLLSSLAAEGLVDRSEENGRWTLGPELYLLGTAAARRYDVTDVAREFVCALARDTGESAFFSARRGDQTVCLAREDGSFPLRSHVLYEGIRFPLGVASAGLAILAHQHDREIASFFDRHDLSAEWGPSHARDAVLSRVAMTREVGYAVNPGLIVEGSWGMGAAVFDRNGRPEWALSLTGVESRFRSDRIPALGAVLLDQAHALTKVLG
jgi:DNA-binding IclR family transcriptional regulator